MFIFICGTGNIGTLILYSSGLVNLGKQMSETGGKKWELSLKNCLPPS